MITYAETGGWRWTVVGLCALVVALGLRLGGAGGPFASPLDDPAIAPAMAARYHLQSGLGVTFGLPVRFTAAKVNGRPTTRFDLSRPVGGPLYLAGWFSLFGVGPVGARTAGLLFLILGLLGLFHLVWRMYGPLTAATTALFVALTPAGVILSARAGPAQAAVGLALVTIWAYLSWVDKREVVFKWAMWLAFGLAILLDWSALCLAVIIPVHYHLSVSRAWRDWPPIVVLPGLALMYLGLHLLFTQLTFDRIVGPGTFLSAWRSQLDFSPLGWLTALGRAAFTWTPLPLTILGLVWLYTRIQPAKYPDLVNPPRVTERILDPRIPIRPRTGPLWILLALAFLPAILAPAWAIGHLQAWWPLVFFLSLAAARALDNLAVRLYHLEFRVALRLVVTAMVAIWCVVQLILAWPAGGSQARDLGHFLAAQTPPGKTILVFRPGPDLAVEFYAQRRIDRVLPGQDGARLVKNRRIARLVVGQGRIKKGTWLDRLVRTRVTKKLGPWVMVLLDKKRPPPPVKKAKPKVKKPAKPVVKPKPAKPPVKPAAKPKPAKPPVKPQPVKPAVKPKPAQPAQPQPAAPAKPKPRPGSDINI